MLNLFIRIVNSTVLPKRWQALPAGSLHQVLSLSVRAHLWSRTPFPPLPPVKFFAAASEIVDSERVGG